MAPGQTPLQLSSKSVDVSLHNDPLSTSAGLNFSASDSSSAATIMFDSANGLGDCGTIRGGYISFAMSETSVIPYQSSESITSGLVRWYAPEAELTNSDSELRNSSFILHIPFTRPLAFYSKSTSRFSNVTFPDCTVRQDEQYVPCDCKSRSYTNNSATFSCSSLPSSLCPREESPSPGRSSRVSVEKQFGTVAASLFRIFEVTLTHTSADWRSAGAVFALFFFLLLVFVGGIVYFSRWDSLDRKTIVYGLASRSAERKARLRSLPDADLFVIRKRYDELFRSGGEIDVGNDDFLDADVELDRRWLNKPKAWTTRFFTFIRSVRRSGTSLLEPIDSGSRFMQCLLRFHPFLWSFTGASVTTTRTIRFVSLFKSFIISLFVSSLLYMFYFPVDRVCVGNSSIDDCLKAPSPLSSGAMCMWNASEGICSLRPPPSDFRFLALVAVTSSLISLPFDVLVSLLLLLVCNKKPKWNAVFGSRVENEDPNDTGEKDQLAADFVLTSLRTLKYYAEESRDNLIRAQYQRTLDIFLSKLGVRFVGYEIFLRYRSRFFFANANEALKYHVKKTRIKGQKILAEIEQFSYLGDDAYAIKGDILLLQFTYEQIGFFRTQVIRPHLDEAFIPEPPLIHPLLWVASWLVVIGVNLFFIVWALQWGLSSNAFTFRNWIANFLLETAWGCFVSSVARIFVLNFLLLAIVRPNIVRTIKNVCDTVVDLDLYEDEKDATYLSRTLSPVCYAASRSEGSDKLLKTVYFLKRLNDSDHGQIKAEAGQEYPRRPQVLRNVLGNAQLDRELILDENERNVVVRSGEECAL